MSRTMSHLDEIAMIGKLADLKDEYYKTTLLLSALTELLIDKGLISVHELQSKTALLDLYGALEASSHRTE